MPRKSMWTPEMDATLRKFRDMRLTTTQAAKRMGLKREAVKKRSVAIGVRFERWTKLSKELASDGHRPAGARSGELLRAAGVRI